MYNPRIYITGVIWPDIYTIIDYCPEHCLQTGSAELYAFSLCAHAISSFSLYIIYVACNLHEVYMGEFV